ncbi:DUF3630 family protein [Alteromonas sp. ASW11-19]|uniref:DUF3630 family protein n=1 Tax=Alteromonas salexigens TaxID=2982530 RepID=A0ABT2VNR8_9ALTE|nr:DUF3630 family protein [Alteromonas salexigens]MCU7554739.1 DUF3630 family protein [Alteromonas salexigens]
MQQLTLSRLQEALQFQPPVVTVHVPLPESAAQTLQWTRHFARLTGLTVISEDWGADRYQAVLTGTELRVMLNIEWLCESIWLEAAGGNGNDAETLWRWCQSWSLPPDHDR